MGQRIGRFLGVLESITGDYIDDYPHRTEDDFNLFIKKTLNVIVYESQHKAPRDKFFKLINLSALSYLKTNTGLLNRVDNKLYLITDTSRWEFTILKEEWENE